MRQLPGVNRRSSLPRRGTREWALVSLGVMPAPRFRPALRPVLTSWMALHAPKHPKPHSACFPSHHTRSSPGRAAQPPNGSRPLLLRPSQPTGCLSGTMASCPTPYSPPTLISFPHSPRGFTLDLEPSAPGFLCSSHTDLLVLNVPNAVWSQGLTHAHVLSAQHLTFKNKLLPTYRKVRESSGYSLMKCE